MAEHAFIFSSGHVDASQLREHLVPGHVEFLPKPYDGAVLVEMIATLVATPTTSAA